VRGAPRDAVVEVPVARTADVAPGTARQVVVQGAVIALSNVGGQLYAMDGVCVHRGGPLGEGDLQGKVLECPLHGWTYDVTSGQSLVNPAAKLRMYPVAVRDGEIFLDL